jgi:capsular exopolysaccharide synthesis family protein
MTERRIARSPLREAGVGGSRRTNESDDAQLDISLDFVLRVLRRHYKLAAIVFVAFLLPAAIYIKRQPAIYRAAARILIEQNAEAGAFQQNRTPDQITGDFQTQSHMLRSRPLIIQVVRKIKLWESPNFSVRPTLTDPTDAQITTSGLVDVFLDHLSITPEPGTHLLNVAFVSEDASAAMQAVNGLIQTHIGEQTKAQFAQSAEVVEWLNQRLEEQRRRLSASEAALQTYVEQKDAGSLQDQQNIVVQKLADLNAAVTKAKTDRIAKQTMYEQLRSAQNEQAALDSLPIVLSNPVLQQLRAQLAELKQKESTLAQELGDRHPDLVKLRSDIQATDLRLKTELRKLGESINNDYAAAQALEQSLVSALDAQKKEVLELNRKGLDFGALQRQATSDRQIYERLLTEAQTRGIAGKTAEQKIRVVESAELPRYPVSPRRMQEYALAFGGALLLALAAPFLREFMDRRVKTPAELEKRLGVTCLAMVPKISTETGKAPLFTNEANAFNESFRRVRTALSLNVKGPGSVRIMVTSAVPREGKSVAAMNIAIAAAQMNQQVLLIDADLRRPKVHRMLGVEPFPGLADALGADASLDEIIRKTEIANLSVLPCGMKQISASELLALPRLERLLEQLEERFDWIVFDTAPIGPVADAAIIAQCVQQAVFIVSAETTPITVAKAAFDQLEATGVSISGAILNRVDLQHSAYYYAPYYNGEYSSYYAAPKSGAARGRRRPEGSIGAAS